jgi:thiosulfate/3-mercaptopyruvate sulfurtransferase
LDVQVQRAGWSKQAEAPISRPRSTGQIIGKCIVHLSACGIMSPNRATVLHSQAPPMTDTAPRESTTTSPLISTADLALRIADAAGEHRKLLICDCSFDLADPSAGERAFGAAHLPGAVYLHLDGDLSAAKTGLNGRHPLPDRAEFADRIAALGVDNDTLVVAYDGSGGMYAARLWWMLRWIGHGTAAVLDGGLGAWRETVGATEAGAAKQRQRGNLRLRESLAGSVLHAALRAELGRPPRLIVDARAANRFRGEDETLDPVGGHIPGARNRFFKDNLGADGRFKSAQTLRAEWQALLAGRDAADIVHQCGSGVTACHNLLAMEAAGLGGSRLYPGSWSEWCAQPGAPVALGPD